MNYPKRIAALIAGSRDWTISPRAVIATALGATETGYTADTETIRDLYRDLRDVGGLDIDTDRNAYGQIVGASALGHALVSAYNQAIERDGGSTADRNGNFAPALWLEALVSVLQERDRASAERRYNLEALMALLPDRAADRNSPYACWAEGQN